ncbi:MAG: tRNA (adenosine(37)-N6)-threonylcarbamoyltransferase complex dimerization subunit type 1 TsaB [Acidobacteriia bacterium]|nr:tRNA (adenosine(37)-N6)-threonylcarbamoyltransferase complex dimerization subunit type 1 TsaB [Terriglobia bacterium]
MLILSVDTSSKAGSIAILRDDVLLGCVETESAESHSVRLFAAIQFLMGQLKLRMNEFNAFAVTTGPGSFAGLRIGVATIKGLSEMHQTPVIPVSTLEAIAATAAEVLPSPRIVALLDARRSELYAGIYGVSEGELKAVESDRLMRVESFFASQPKAPCQFAGPDVDRFTSFIAPNSGSGWSFLKTSWYLAPQVARLAARKFERAEMVSSDRVSIHYIRRSDAEMMFKG